MIADLKPYLKMRDSGVEWLGEVLEHWGYDRWGRLDDSSREAEELRPTRPNRGCRASAIVTSCSLGRAKSWKKSGSRRSILSENRWFAAATLSSYGPRSTLTRVRRLEHRLSAAASQKILMGRGITVMHIYSSDLSTWQSRFLMWKGHLSGWDYVVSYELKRDGNSE